MNTVYGITNCQTVQKALTWLKENNVEYTFHDYKKQGIDEKNLQKWCAKFGWESVLNRAGMMWRKANEEEKAKVIDEKSAIEFMIKTPNSIKRPIIEYDGGILKGFDVAQYGVLN